MPTFYDMLKFAATGIAAPDMTAYDKMRALAAFGGGKAQTLTGQPPLSFHANGTPLISWSMKGNGSQTGTPTHDAPIMPDFCGTLDGTDWKIPITCAGQTTPVYLGQTQTVRKIRKLVLTGEETNWSTYTRADSSTVPYLPISNFKGAPTTNVNADIVCTHYATKSQVKIQNLTYRTGIAGRTSVGIIIADENITTLDDFKAYLAQQYAAGTPVTVWYVLAEPETAIVNEPLCKIGDYADELHSTDAAVTIPTVKGDNTLTVDTDLQPSEMTITYKG